jgi:hypothetical protein
VGALIAPPIVGATLSASATGSITTAYVLFGLFGLPIIATLTLFPTPGPTSRAFYRSSSTWAVSTPVRVSVSDDTATTSKTDSQGADAHASIPAIVIVAPPTLCTMPRRDLIITVATAIFLCCYVGTELVAGAFTSPFAVKNPYLRFSEERAADLVSCFWGSFALSRLLTIFVSVYVSAFRLLCGSLSGCFLAVGLLLWYGASGDAILWWALFVFGFSMGPCYPAAITLAGAYTEITTTSGIVFTIGAASGEMALPALTSYLFTLDTTHVWRVCCGGLLGGFLCFAFITLGFSPKDKEASAAAATDTVTHVAVANITDHDCHGGARCLTPRRDPTSTPLANHATIHDYPNAPSVDSISHDEHRPGTYASRLRSTSSAEIEIDGVVVAPSSQKRKTHPHLYASVLRFPGGAEVQRNDPNIDWAVYQDSTS